MRINKERTKWLVIYKCTWILGIIILLAIPDQAQAQTPTADDILAKSIAYHDPDGIWSQERHLIVLEEKRPNGSTRETKLTIDLDRQYFQSDQVRDKHHIVSNVTAGGVEIKIDGQPPLDSALIKKYRLDSKRMVFMSNYYIYLYGLPMKLLDPGTIIDPHVQDTVFQDQSVYGLKVTYTPEVGKDIWYFYFDRNNYALRGYRFYHDESANDGEYITLEGEANNGNFKLPKSRKWFTHKENKFLGEDVIVEIK